MKFYDLFFGIINFYNVVPVLISGQDVDNVEVLKGGAALHTCFTVQAGSTQQYIDFYHMSYDDPEQYDLVAKFLVSQRVITVEKPFQSLYQGSLAFPIDGKYGYVNISQVFDSKEGYYRCDTNGFDATKETISFTVTMHEAPTVTVVKDIDPLVAGNSEVVAARCMANGGKPQVTSISWSTNANMAYDETITNSTNTNIGVVRYDAEASLLIRPTEFYNNLKFTCTVKHPAYTLKTGSDRTETVITLNVNFPPSSTHIDVVEAGTKLTCLANGNPAPSFRWQMPPISTTPTVYGDTVEIIDPSNPDRQNDTYICIAYNDIQPDGSANITTHGAGVIVTMVAKSNTGIIVGAIFGGLLLLALIAFGIYWLLIRKTEDDEGPYTKGKASSGTRPTIERYGESSEVQRPTITHANDSINKNRPPSPNDPPPDEEEPQSSQSEEEDEGDDVEIIPRASTRGITSQASINFQKDRKRPSTSPRAKARPKYDSPPGYTDPRYEVPPGDYDDDDRQNLTHDQHGYNEDPDSHLYDLPQDRYPGYFQDQPQGYPDEYTDDREYQDDYNDHNEPVTYARLDNRYLGDPNNRHAPREEQVEYAHIRPAYVV